MSKTPNHDLKVKQILDSLEPGERVCELTGEKWMMDEEEIGWYKKFNVPPSKRAPLTRWWCQTAFYLAGQWWWNKHIKTGEPLLTFVHPATGVRIMPDKEWFDSDFLSEGKEVDPNRSIFDQMRELQLRVPMLAERNVKEPENSIAKFSMGDVNSYFVMFTRSRNSLFSHWVMDMEDSSEIWNGAAINKSYNIANSQRIFDCKFVRESFDCIGSSFLFDCRNCENCFGAWNKRNKKYLWWNEQLSKEEWKKRFAEVDLSCRSRINELIKRFSKVVSVEAIWPENFNEKAINSTGEFLTNVNNCINCYSCIDGPHDLCWVNYSAGDSFDSAYCSGLFQGNNCYYSGNTTDSSGLRFSYSCGNSQNLEYCFQCFNCEDCFACNGLNRKRFCIFNTQYTEEDYWKKVDELKCWMMDKEEYGEWFPLNMAPGYFPDSGGPMYFAAPPEVGKEKLGALDFDPESEGAIGAELSDTSKLRQASELPDCLDDFHEKEWVGVPVFDPILKRRFSYIKPEIEFHRRHKIALSHEHFILRAKRQYQESNSGKYETVICKFCNKDIFTSVNITYPNRKIYCRACYLDYLEKEG